MFLRLRDLCENWYCMLVSRLLYQNPAVKAFDLQYHTQVRRACLCACVCVCVCVCLRVCEAFEHSIHNTFSLRPDAGVDVCLSLPVSRPPCRPLVVLHLRVRGRLCAASLGQHSARCTGIRRAPGHQGIKVSSGVSRGGGGVLGLCSQIHAELQWSILAWHARVVLGKARSTQLCDVVTAKRAAIMPIIAQDPSSYSVNSRTDLPQGIGKI